jgi:hypothetical protein
MGLLLFILKARTFLYLIVKNNLLIRKTVMTQISIKQIKQQQLLDFINNTIGISLNEGQIRDIVDQINDLILNEINSLDNKLDMEVEDLNKKVAVSTMTKMDFSSTPATRIYPLPQDIDLEKYSIFVLNGIILWEGDNKDYTINTSAKNIKLNFDIKTSDHFMVEYYKKIN